jgi:hypothetical protein
MGGRDWAVLAFKLLGLWFAAQGVVGLGDLVYVFQSDHGDAVRSVGVVGLLLRAMIAAGVGAVLWANAATLARHVVSDAAEVAAAVFGDGPGEPTRAAIGTHPFFALALALVGVLMVTEAVPQLFHALVIFASSRRAGSAILGPDPAERARLWNADVQAGLAAALARFAIGVACLAGPARLAAAYAGVRKELRGTLADEPAPPDASDKGGAS